MDLSYFNGETSFITFPHVRYGAAYLLNRDEIRSWIRQSDVLRIYRSAAYVAHKAKPFSDHSMWAISLGEIGQADEIKGALI